jgi:hypothetical protein
MAALPSIGHFVELHATNGRSSLGRVQEASAERLVVALPSDAGVASAGTVGDAFDLIWPGPDGGVMILGSTLSGRHGATQLELWEFAATGAAHFEQRRHEPRIPVSGAVRMTIDPDAEQWQGPALTGSLVDVSATAVQCVVNVGAEDVVVTGGTRVRCELTLEGTPVSLRGEVLAAWTEDSQPTVRVVVRFAADQPDLAVVSRYVAATAARIVTA